ncbi:MAG: ComF family protein [Candidatus Dormibacteria bacterium]
MTTGARQGGDVLEFALDAVFPRRCGGCLARGTWLCEDCRAAVRAAPVTACRRCHRPVSLDPCPMCEAGEGPDAMIAMARLEGPLREAVHRFKYGDRPQLAPYLVAAAWRPASLGPGIVVPVPLHPGRRRRRGYNQAALLADSLSRLAGNGVLEALRREGVAGRQVGRGGEDRRRSLDGAFAWTADVVPDAVVILDDVLTTGTTLLQCSLAARAAGVKRVDALALALG